MAITKIEVFEDGKVDFVVDKPHSVRILPLEPVWLVFYEDWDHNVELTAVCSTEEKANNYAKAARPDYYVVEWGIDTDNLDQVF